MKYDAKPPFADFIQGQEHKTKDSEYRIFARLHLSDKTAFKVNLINTLDLSIFKIQ